MINHVDLMAALTADFMNVYVVEPSLDKATTIKAKGYTTIYDGDSSGEFCYSKHLSLYAEDRVCEEDRDVFLRTLSPRSLLGVFASGKDNLEVNYRVLTDCHHHHFCAFLSRIAPSKEGGLRVVLGFRNIDSVISLQRKKRDEGLYNAYATISNIYTAMYRISLKTNTYASIKTTDDVLRHIIPDSNVYDLTAEKVIRGLATEKSLQPALDFLNAKTLEQRMAGKSHISMVMETKAIGECRLHFIKEDEDSDGSLHHVILAVEKLPEDEYQSIFDVLARGFQNVFWVDLKAGMAKILKLDGYVTEGLNRDDRNLFSYTAILGRYVKDRVHPEDKAPLLDKIGLDKIREVFSSESEYIGNYRVLIDGETHYCQYNYVKLISSDHLICGFQNIDSMIEEHLAQERKTREAWEAHQKEAEEHAEVISSLSTIYTTIFRANVLTHEYEILSSVPLMGKVATTNGNFDDVKEKIINAFMAPEMRDPMKEFLDLNTLSERMKGVNTIAAEYRNPEGRWFQARFIVKKRDESGAVLEVLYVARDFTREKEEEHRQQERLSIALAAAEQASKAKTTFLNSMSHDIRTPMNAIIGFTALAQTHLDNKELVQDYLGKISTSSTHLLSLINDILDMSRIESGTVKLDEKPVHLPDLLHDLRTMIQGLVSSKNQNLYIDTQDVKNEDVIVDKLRLNQILINIVGNAIKFTQPGGDIIICLAEKPCSTPHRATFVFSVKDNGVGMSKKFMDHIFDSFAREHSSTESGVQGTGLGMAITKNIVDMMGGKIEVESEEGKGSKFTVTLNVRLANEPVKYGPIPELLGARALVIDDDIETCRNVCKMLRSIEMRPEWTTSGKEAILRVQDASEVQDEYKVYIVDYLMPDMNGIETVRRIRKIIGDDVPIIVLTAYDWSDFEEEARAAGVTCFVAKPIFMSELRDVLSSPNHKASPRAPEKGKRVYDYRGKRALLVEDNELNREIAVELLEETGMEIDWVSDGIDAVEAINKSPAGKYDLILMDIQMPTMDGYTATREIRTLPDNAKANIPIVAMTANAFEEDRNKALEAGMNGHIVKPISIEAIAQTIDPLFEGR